MKTYADYKFDTYEVSGHELRIHWDIKQVTRTDLAGNNQTQWEANEALCNVKDTRGALIEKIIGSVYSFAGEIATINNKDAKPDDYDKYQLFRDQAKALADGWLSQK